VNESSSFRRTHRSTSSSAVGPLHRSRSVGTFSTPARKQKDSTEQLSKIRDHDLKTNVEAKVVNIMCACAIDGFAPSMDRVVLFDDRSFAQPSTNRAALRRRPTELSFRYIAQRHRPTEKIRRSRVT